MCGPDAAQQNLENEQMQFYSTLQARDQTTFGEQQDILTQMQAIYQPILQRGPNAPGFSQAERDNLNATADTGVATNFAQTSKALNEAESAEGGGNDYLPSGVTGSQNAGLAAAAAATRSSEEGQIKTADYTQGYQQFKDATGALDTAAGLYDPNAGASVATSAGSAAESTAKDIAAENTSWMAPVFGAIGAVGGAAAGAELGK